jgi:hypothetical protein
LFDGPVGLLLAPSDEKALKEGKPSLDWTHLGSYDTAKECEMAKTAIIASVAMRRKLQKIKSLDTLVTYSSARCLPSDIFPK